MHFLLTTLNAVYVLNTPYLTKNDNETLEQACQRSKFKKDDYIVYISRGHIFNMSDVFFDVYQEVESVTNIWGVLENKYMTVDASSKNFLVSQFNNYKMVEERSLLDQLHKI